jgi:DHA1 family inner membrane transport protein
MPIALLALTISAFAIGTTEFVIVGLLPTVAADLNISLPSAGLLVSLYALGVAIGAPLLTALTGKLPRKTLLLGLMALFTLGNLLAWQAPGYNSLIAARILTGLAHGVFFSIGSTIATGLVPKEKAASAIAIMFTGLTVALVTGVPLGTFIGQHFGWRETFLAVSALGAIAFVVSLIFVPRSIQHTPPASRDPAAQGAGPAAPPAGVCDHGRGLRRLVHPVHLSCAHPAAGRVSAPARSSWVMLVYGVSVAAGNIWGGKLADRQGPIAALKIIFALLAAVLLLFSPSPRRTPGWPWPP